MITEIKNIQQQAYQYLITSEYNQATNLYEQAISANPDIKSNYWYMGLSLLLQGQEAEAQMTWMLPMTEVEENVLIYTQELIAILESEAERQEHLEEFDLAWVIRQHIREIQPENIYNLLKIISASIKLNAFEGQQLYDLQIIDLLKSQEFVNLNLELLFTVLKQVLDTLPLHSSYLELVEASLTYFINSQEAFYILLPAAIKIGHTFKCPGLAADIIELYLRLEPNNVEALRHLAIFYQDDQNYLKGIENAKLCYSLSQELADKIFALHLVLRGLMSAGGYWHEIYSTSQELEDLLLQFIKAQPLPTDEIRTIRLLSPSFAIPHIKDTPAAFRKIHNQIAQIFQNNIQGIFTESVERYSQRIIKNKTAKIYQKSLKIGYLSYALRKHSVGWLARWLFDHHNHQNFEIYTYLINYKRGEDFLQEWYVSKADKAQKLGVEAGEIADKISEDEIDILVDLDSITLDIASEVIAHKPAPIQATWLGWDASGIPAIDYFIADPYVLPDSAQEYYTEKIWRLPQTYIAVDGFEVGIPTLRRQDLDIPNDAVIYLSAQRGYKRHPETTRWQMKIIKEVPNSYFLIKGDAEQEAIKEFFYKIAEEEGVDCSRLRFLSQDPSEAVHRANLAIADVVLDTYPYNGATTTLETLWMGIPIVTRVGEQFAARNSYTMMMNVGVKEGIAWTDEEYIEWGVKLGKDPVLRQQIAWKLRQSRQTAPLWNGKQFTLEMEKAYQQMWQRYLEG
jgi:predicted O-linked N-acetylglucosamine transferase (SPINDLY family)